MAKHAILSPSGASRWLACTPSARLEQKFKDRAGKAAEEGTLAHAIAEQLLLYKLGRITAAKFNLEHFEFKKDALYNEEMFDYVKEYVNEVLEVFSEAQAISKDAIIMLEQRVYMYDYAVECDGTADVVIIANGNMWVIDLKYGKGVKVEAEENKQLMLYGLGSFLAHDFAYGIDKLHLTIKQPRLNASSTYEISAKDLTAWAEMELKPLAALAYAGDGKFKPGAHCQFCKAKGSCRTLAEYNLDIVKHDFKQPDLLEPDEISDIILKSKFFTDWLKGVGDYAFAQALAGVKWPGLKLVEGRSNRAYADEQKVIEVLRKEGIEEIKIFEPLEVLGITKMEKSIGKNVFNSLLTPLVIKPKGKPTLVAESDKRAEFNDASADFDGFDSDEEI